MVFKKALPKKMKRWKYDKGFYGHMTHESLQAQEDSVDCFGDGFHDSSVPKTPVSDGFVSKNRVFYTC